MSNPEETYIAKNGWITKKGWKFLYQAALDIFIHRSDIEGVRTSKHPGEPLTPTPYEKFMRKLKGIVGDEAELLILEGSIERMWFVELKWVSEGVSCKYERRFPRSVFHDRTTILDFLSTNFLDALVLKDTPKRVSIEPTILDRVMVQLRESFGESGVLILDNEEETGAIRITVKWIYREKPFLVSRSFNRTYFREMMSSDIPQDKLIELFISDFEQEARQVEKNES